MKKHHAKRLLKLAEFLETKVPKKQFRFRDYVDIYARDVKPDLSCGTKACALGWACVMPEFRRLGASIKGNGEGAYGASLCLRGVPTNPDEIANVLFGTDGDDTFNLFIDGAGRGYDPTPKQVDKTIRKFVKERCPEALG